MSQALESLNLAHLWIVYPGEHPYPLSKQISVWPMKEVEGLDQYELPAEVHAPPYFRVLIASAISRLSAATARLWAATNAS
jgi:hypothetical protein